MEREDVVEALLGAREALTETPAAAAFSFRADCEWVDGTHSRTSASAASAAHSRTGYIVFFAGCPLIWTSQLQSSIALSTLEAEYTALSILLHTILPLRSMLVEVSGILDLPANMQASIHCRVFQDNNGSLQLVTEQ